MNINMWKVFKRAVQLSAALVIFGIGVFLVAEKSEVFATDMVYLSCDIIDANAIEGEDEQILDAVIKNHVRSILGRLKKDWVKNEVLLNWIDHDSRSENGLQDTVRLKIEVGQYTGYNWSGKVRRTFNRETLLYRVDYEKSGYWVERQCYISQKDSFEKLRKQMAIITKAKQKI